MLMRMWGNGKSFIASKNVKYYSHFGRQFGHFSNS